MYVPVGAGALQALAEPGLGVGTGGGRTLKSNYPC
jgi:hypothetical protein